MKTLLTTIAVAGGLVMIAGTANAASQYQCQQYAQSQADAYAPTGQGLVAGGIIGALGGGLIAGATGGNAGTGAIIGGVGGAVVGGAANQNKRQQIFNNAYWNCMNSGGPAPQPVYNSGPMPSGYDEGYLIGSAEWMQACSYKYKSFQWDGPYEGQFKGFDGYWHWCNL